jgi:hypothetical protein
MSPKINIVKAATQKSRPITGAGWWKENERHSRAAKTGHAGGSYHEGDPHAPTRSKSAQPSKQSKSKRSLSNSFCEVCGKVL